MKIRPRHSGKSDYNDGIYPRIAFVCGLQTRSS